MSAFQIASVDDLVRLVNVSNGTTYATADLAVTALQAVTDGTWQGVATEKNTAAQLTGQAPKYKGKKTVLYDRLDLAQLADLPGLVLMGLSGTMTYDLLVGLKNLIGISFTELDLENLPVSLSSTSGGTITLTAASTSIGWVGTVTLPVVGLPDISTVFNSTVLAGF